MMKTVRHNRKELKHIENSLKRNSVNKPVKVNNFLFMDNQERFENVCLGYSIQAERLMNIVQQSTAGTITKDWVTPERKTAIEQSSVLMEMIQLQLLKLKEANGKYQKHIKNSIYCQQLLRSYISINAEQQQTAVDDSIKDNSMDWLQIIQVVLLVAILICLVRKPKER